ncbi:hypothetical protein ILUMI_16199 [Ignelater luminosus]|uniref:Uncharacterized protein n=1 Tax=Ignelater luminosus TaxID=2038154 RepID=A0A8K0CM64_IGNLU|nr:hypothetical protein ILUMI_16199 [Ignelater luminosus]
MKGLVSPEDIRPYPKGQTRKESNRGHPKGRRMVATDTPEKILTKKKKMPIKRRLFEAKSFSFEEEGNFSVHSEDSEIDWAGKNSNKEEPGKGSMNHASFKVGDWATVEYSGDLFPGQIKSINVLDLLI